MSSLIINEPSIVRLNDISPQSLERTRRFLTFQDGGVAYLLSKHQKQYRWKRNDPEGWDTHKETLKQQLNRCILFQDDKGYYTYSGLADQLSQSLLCDAPVERHQTKPEARGFAWANVPKHEDRYYQEEAGRALLGVGHGGVEMGTGLGKTKIMLNLVRYLGLKTIIIAPSSSILTQLMKDFKYHLGPRYIGQFGAGKKKFDRKVTIATFQSLTRLEPGDEAWEALSKADVLILDESHISPASTLEKVCMGLARNAKYRFFVSATQTRGDGSAIVLKGITGPIVYSMSVQKGVDEGFLAKPYFKIIKIPSKDNFESADVMKMTRKHLYYNSDIIKRAADIANQAVSKLGHKVLIQIEEISQFAHLLRHLEFDPRFAHGAAKSDPELKSKLPEKYWDSDPSDLVDKFNDEQFPILVGTSCIGMGTDLKVPETVINLMGGMSPIGIPQAVGRGTRKHIFKDGRNKISFNFIDFIPTLRTKSYNDKPDLDEESCYSPLYRHGLVRAKMYENLYPNIKWM